jgi:3-isopropylmalate/(R)-2-methylmalate dehydratase small subunit
MSDLLEARARCFGDDVNTDYIISSSRKRVTIDADVLKQYLLESIDPGFAASVREGDVLVAGRNFGCGSAMEVAATVILASGIRAVLAQSFARAFFRNAINNGLMPIEIDTREIREGDRLEIRAPEAARRLRAPAAPREDSESSNAGARATLRLAQGRPEGTRRSSGGGAPRALRNDGQITVAVRRTGTIVTSPPWPALVSDILTAGGLVPYLRREGRFRL